MHTWYITFENGSIAKVVAGDAESAARLAVEQRNADAPKCGRARGKRKPRRRVSGSDILTLERARINIRG